MKRPIKILIVFGTRPEAIKMAPLIKAFSTISNVVCKVCVTAQHREMLDQVITFFDIQPDYDLNLMQPGQTLHLLTANIITRLKEILEDYRPHYVMVHGDTTTSMAAALAAFYSGCKVCHVEAGLRTYKKTSPFPEEINRQLTARIADFHFAPTITSKNNLVKEFIPESSIMISGNTVIDALQLAVNKLKTYSDSEIERLKLITTKNRRIILVTGHRRENFGEGFLNIFEALKTTAVSEDVQIIYPVHLNPNVRQPVHQILGGIENISLIEPLAYAAFVWLMQQSYIIVTDSGGIQEEAPSLGKPVLVLRDTTERPEAIEYGTAKLVGIQQQDIVSSIRDLLHNDQLYKKMSDASNPYGDGLASERIVQFLLKNTDTISNNE